MGPGQGNMTIGNTGSFFSDIFDGLGQIGSAISPALPGIAGTLLTGEAYNRLSDVGREAEQAAMGLAERGLAESQFKPFTVTTTTGGQLGTRVTPTGAVETTMGLSPQEQMLQQQLMGQAGQMFGQPVTGQAQLAQAGLGALGAGQQLMGQPTFGMAPTQAASQQAFGLGGQFMGAAGMQPADINLLRGQFAGQVGGLLGQQPSAGVGQLGQQALGLGMQGLGTTAPEDVEALRRQYGGLAGQAAQQVLQPTAGREAEVFERIRATQRPGEERQRLALEERLAAQGRLGTSSAAYGGATPEQLAMATAQEEARNRASLSAIQQAQAERQQALGEAQAFGGLFGQQADLSSQLQSQAQQRAAQLSQLGLSAEQVQSQLQSEGLGRATTAAGQTGQLAQLAGALQAQQAGLGAQYAGLGSTLAGQQQALDAARQQQALQALTAGQGLLGGGLGLQQLQQQLGTTALGASYLPQTQLLAATQPAQRMAELQQQAQLYGTGLFGETALSGVEARLLAEQARANLLGGVGSNILSGLFTPQVTSSGTILDPGGFGNLGDIFGGIGEGLGTIGRATGIIGDD